MLEIDEMRWHRASDEVVTTNENEIDRLMEKYPSGQISIVVNYETDQARYDACNRISRNYKTSIAYRGYKLILRFGTGVTRQQILDILEQY